MPLARTLKRLTTRGSSLFRRMFPTVTWAGMYERTADVPARGGYEADAWVRATRERTRQQMEAAPGSWDFLPLVMLTGSLLRGSPTVRILDHGGGMGIAYVELRRSLGPEAGIEVVVVELPRVADEGRALFAADRSISFTTELTAGPFDIVHSCGALQYVADPLGCLRQLLAYRAPHVLITKIPAGRNPRYATAQLNVSGSVIPCWMLDLGELEAVARGEGYSVRTRVWSEYSLIRKYRTRGIPRQLRPERFVSLLLTIP